MSISCGRLLPLCDDIASHNSAKYINRTPFTLGSESIILKAFYALFLWRHHLRLKVGWLTTMNFMISIVAIARPAPLTMHPILPSGLYNSVRALMLRF